MLRNCALFCGALRVTLESPQHQRSGGSGDHVLCGRCGVYMGAMIEADGRRLATLNLNAFDDPLPDFAGVPAPPARGPRRQLKLRSRFRR
jgi:hypothetical protein